jgi:hypothetical protein
VRALVEHGPSSGECTCPVRVDGRRFGVDGACPQHGAHADPHWVQAWAPARQTALEPRLQRASVALRMAYLCAFGEASRDEVFAREKLDELTRQVTAFESFAALVTAPGGYQPTLHVGPLALAYDAHQAVWGDARRAEVRP